MQSLRDYVESSPYVRPSLIPSDDHQEEEAGDFEILKESPMLWDGKFKLEIGGNS